ncbi:MAG: RNA methyltransferase [Maribacter sp.]|nr:RNA methyltransferase [Maribacter sp.]
MVVKSQIKFIKNLQQKKYRNQNGMFVVEGIKTVQELLDSNIEPYKIYCSNSVLFPDPGDHIEIISEADLKKISSLKNPNKVLGIFKIPEPRKVSENDWILALDDVRDPGNLGTIIRLCDWFGIEHLVCSEHTVDCYNPKVIQATMGSIARVNIVYTDLVHFLDKSEMPVYGTFMKGNNVQSTELPLKGILVMGNEANGISKEIESLVTSKISIPQPRSRKARDGSLSTESLNVATAAAIFLNEIRRN